MARAMHAVAAAAILLVFVLIYGTLWWTTSDTRSTQSVASLQLNHGADLAAANTPSLVKRGTPISDALSEVRMLAEVNLASLHKLTALRGVTATESTAAEKDAATAKLVAKVLVGRAEHEQSTRFDLIPARMKSCICEKFQAFANCQDWSQMADQCQLHELFGTDKLVHAALREESATGQCTWAECAGRKPSNSAASNTQKVATAGETAQAVFHVGAEPERDAWALHPADSTGHMMENTQCRTAALAWLSGRSIVMIGDSLMRYQYLSLIYWIEHGQWLWSERILDDPNPCREPDFFAGWVTDSWLAENHLQRASTGMGPGGWTAYLVMVMRRFKGNERCDCTKSFVAEENIENRYYYSPQHNITVTFFLKYGAATIKGRYFADGGPPSHLTNLSYHELGQRVHDWEFHHGDLVRQLRSGTLKTGHELPTDFTLIINQGFWADVPAQLKQIVEDVTLVSDSPGSKATRSSLWWKTTNAMSRSTSATMRNTLMNQGQIKQFATAKEWNVLDALDLTHELSLILPAKDDLNDPYTMVEPEAAMTTSELVHHADRYHFQPWVYNAMNAAWLYKLCQMEGDLCAVPPLTKISAHYQKVSMPMILPGSV